MENEILPLACWHATLRTQAGIVACARKSFAPCLQARRPKVVGLECDLCEKEIERNVMRCCACKRAFHLECLAADWNMQ
eukprot:scaffold71552_cov18-Tisochrysis_lutea.AAC.2